MAQIIPSRYKPHLPRGMQYPLRCSDFEGVFAGSADANVFVSAGFRDHQDWRKKERERLAHEGRYHLVEIKTNPPVRRYPDSSAPWHDVENAIVVGVTVYSVPHEVAHRVGLTRDLLRDTLAAEVGGIVGRGRFAERWEVRLDLLAEEEVIEVVTATWNGIRPDAERRFRVALARPAEADEEPAA